MLKWIKSLFRISDSQISIKPASGYSPMSFEDSNDFKIYYSFKRAYADDWEFIRTLRNNQKVNFIEQHEIQLQEHYEYMAKHWQNYWIMYRINHYGSYKCGFIGVVNDDIRFCVSKSYQGNGIGTRMLKFIKEQYPNAIGKVKHDNIASQKAFIKAGYSCYKQDDEFCYYTI